MRGFVEGVTITAAAFLEHAEELYARFPILHLSLEEVDAVIEDLAQSPYLGRLISLHFHSTDLTDRGLEILSQSPYLKELCILSGGGTTVIGERGIEAVAAHAENLPRLEIFESIASETWGTDSMTGLPIADAIDLPPFGRYLEQKYGYLRFLHAPSRMPGYPPYRDDFDIEDTADPIERDDPYRGRTP